MLFKIECQQCGLQEKAPFINIDKAGVVQVQMPMDFNTAVVNYALEEDTLCPTCTADLKTRVQTAVGGFVADQSNAIKRRGP